MIITFGIKMNDKSKPHNSVDPDMTLRQARDQFYKENGFPEDGGISQDHWSPFGCRDLKVYLPNFEWRRKAIPFHDLHHIITGYAFSPTGEFQLSAWEFAAGRYRNILTTLFCIPLIALGAVIIPRRAFFAFVSGRRSRTLYSGVNYEDALTWKIREARKDFLPQESIKINWSDFLQYGVLVMCSAIVILLPFSLLAFSIMSLI